MTRDELASALGLSDALEGYTPQHRLDLQGWNSDTAAFDVAFEQVDPAILVDVGVWKGGSTIALAERLRRSGRGYVVAVDTFLGSPEHWLPTDHGDFRADLLVRNGLPGLYWQFASNVRLRELDQFIVPFPQTSANAAIILQRLGFAADLIHIDGAHDERSLNQDLDDWWPLVRPGGAIVVDDYVEQWPVVKAVVDAFGRSHAERTVILPPKAILFK